MSAEAAVAPRRRAKTVRVLADHAIVLASASSGYRIGSLSWVLSSVAGAFCRHLSQPSPKLLRRL